MNAGRKQPYTILAKAEIDSGDMTPERTVCAPIAVVTTSDVTAPAAAPNTFDEASVSTIAMPAGTAVATDNVLFLVCCSDLHGSLRAPTGARKAAVLASINKIAANADFGMLFYLKTTIQQSHNLWLELHF
jgi:hypothetical protein